MHKEISPSPAKPRECTVYTLLQHLYEHSTIGKNNFYYFLTIQKDKM